MASKDKTSKTARVMNLLSKKPDPALEAETDAPAEKPAAPVPPIVTSIAPDAAVSVQIKNALEDALESELGPQAAAPQPEPRPEPEPQPEHVPVQISVPVEEPEPESTPEPAPQPVAQEPAPVPAPPVEESTVWKEPLQPENPGYINVMQVLVEEKAPAYIKKFGLCTCKQCEADVKALTLTNLVPKYVVLSKLDRIPMLTVYEGRFNSTVFAQLTRACKVVMDHPHHHR